MEQTPHSSGSTPELPIVSRESLGNFATPEVQPGVAVERREQRGEAAPIDASTASPPLQLPVPVVVADSSAVVPATTQASDDDDLPTVASDDDLIEKEWVSKTKKVLAETKDDPYRREQEVGRIQRDYLLKRYGRELGSRDDE